MAAAAAVHQASSWHDRNASTPGAPDERNGPYSSNRPPMRWSSTWSRCIDVRYRVNRWFSQWTSWNVSTIVWPALVPFRIRLSIASRPIETFSPPSPGPSRI